VEREKLLIEILKIKLLFFSTVVGGSFGYFLNNENDIFNKVILILLMLSGIVGVIKSLYELSLLYKEIKDKK